MTYVIIAIGIFFIWLLIELKRAPKGWEDQDGFHFGNKSNNKI